MSCSDIGLSRNQQVFVVKETTCGTLVFPSGTGATLGFIRPAGNAVMNQNPAFSDSEELRNTLDILDQFQAAMPPGDWSIPMYCRPHGTLGEKPQGTNLFESVQGSLNAATTAALVSNITAANTTLDFDTLAGGVLPEHGVIQIDSEYMRYTTQNTTSSASTGNITNITRGHGGSTAAVHATDAVVTVKSVFYKQAIESPSLSVWIQTDHFVQGMSGCAVNQMTVDVNNEGGVALNFTGQGMQMVWAGTDTLQAGYATNATQIVVSDADRFSANARLQNYTKSDDNSDSGYVISSVNTTTNTITLSSGIAATWATSDTVKGYLPTGTVIGSAIEARRTSIELNSVAAQFRTTTITFDTPKKFLTDEVGTTYPQAYVEDVRSITFDMNIYFRQASAKYFQEGYNGNDVTVELIFGETAGSKMMLWFKKTRLEVPAINFDPPTIALSMPGKALGTSGEDSCEICFE